MRNYKQRLEELRRGISQDRHRYLCAYCRTKDGGRLGIIDDVLQEEFGDDQLTRWIWLDVVKGYKWQRLEAMHIPCSIDAYRIYRARFYRALHFKLGDGELPGRHKGAGE